MVDDISLSNSDFVIPVVYLVLRLETPRIFCMSTQLFDTRLIGFEVPDLEQPVIKSDSQPCEDY